MLCKPGNTCIHGAKQALRIAINETYKLQLLQMPHLLGQIMCTIRNIWQTTSERRRKKNNNNQIKKIKVKRKCLVQVISQSTPWCVPQPQTTYGRKH